MTAGGNRIGGQDEPAIAVTRATHSNVTSGAFDLFPSAAATFWKKGGGRFEQSKHSSSKAKKKRNPVSWKPASGTQAVWCGMPGYGFLTLLTQ